MNSSRIVASSHLSSPLHPSSGWLSRPFSILYTIPSLLNILHPWTSPHRSNMSIVRLVVASILDTILYYTSLLNILHPWTSPHRSNKTNVRLVVASIQWWVMGVHRLHLSSTCFNSNITPSNLTALYDTAVMPVGLIWLHPEIMIPNSSAHIIYHNTVGGRHRHVGSTQYPPSGSILTKKQDVDYFLKTA